MKRRIHVVVILAIVIPVLILVSLGYIGTRTALEAEKTLHATNLVAELLRIHVDMNGTWPRSWDDLESLPSLNRSMYMWPRDIKDIQSRVSVNFMANLDDLAEESVETFEAILPIGPYYPYKDYYIPQLLDSIRRSRHSEVMGT